MATSRKTLREEIKMQYVDKFTEFLKDTEDVLRVGSNELAFPVVDREGNEDFVVITIKIPTGANKGTEPYDGFAMAEAYAMKLEENRIKAEKRKKEKEEKAKRDKERRAKEAEIKAKMNK